MDGRRLVTMLAAATMLLISATARAGGPPYSASRHFFQEQPDPTGLASVSANSTADFNTGKVSASTASSETLLPVGIEGLGVTHAHSGGVVILNGGLRGPGNYVVTATLSSAIGNASAVDTSPVALVPDKSLLFASPPCGNSLCEGQEASAQLFLSVSNCDNADFLTSNVCRLGGTSVVVGGSDLVAAPSSATTETLSVSFTIPTGQSYYIEIDAGTLATTESAGLGQSSASASATVTDMTISTAP